MQIIIELIKLSSAYYKFKRILSTHFKFFESSIGRMIINSWMNIIFKGMFLSTVIGNWVRNCKNKNLVKF